MKTFRRFWKDDSGATAIEYVLIASFISVAIVAGATAIGSKLGPIYNNVAAGIR